MHFEFYALKLIYYLNKKFTLWISTVNYLHVQQEGIYSKNNKPSEPAQAESDRYAALADLDNTLRTLSFSSSDTNPFASSNVSL